jgi:hypothetical protein
MLEETLPMFLEGPETKENIRDKDAEGLKPLTETTPGMGWLFADNILFNPDGRPVPFKKVNLTGTTSSNPPSRGTFA